MIDDESQFNFIHNEIAPTPTPRQSQVALDIEMSKTDDDETEEQQVQPILNLKINKPRDKNNLKKTLFLHYTHENRLTAFKRDIHEIYNLTFNDPSVRDVHIIVGNRNRPKAQNELIHKRAKNSLRRPNKQPGY
jgi:hypothetical protein